MKDEKQKYENLIRSCFELFMRFGIKSLTMEDLSKKLGISKKTLYLNVKDKKELVKKGMFLHLKEKKSEMESFLFESENAIDELVGFTRLASSRLSDLHAYVVFDIKKYHYDAWELMEDYKENFVRKSVLNNINRGVQEEIYRKNLNPEIITSLYMVMLDGLCSAEDNFDNLYALKSLYLEMVSYHVRGIANDKGLDLLRQSLKKQVNSHLNLD
jgi:hypothetical protein